MAYDDVQDHVEDHGRYEVSFGHSVVPLEGKAIVFAVPGHYGKMSPLLPEEPERPGAEPVRRENLKAPVLVQGHR